MSSEFEAALAQSRRALDDTVERAQKQADDAARIQGRLSSLLVSRTSLQGDVTVHLNGSGMLANVEFADAALTRPGPALSTSVMETLKAARLRLRDRAISIAAEESGDGSFTASVTREYQSTFGTDPVDED